MKHRIPMQKISEGLSGNRNATAEYVGAAKKEFKECLERLFVEIAKQAYNNESTDIAHLAQPALDCWESYFRTMKGGTNIRRDAVEDLVQKEFERQKRFYRKLAKLRERFRELSVRFAVKSPYTRDDRSAGEIPWAWDTGLSAGCDITVGATGFFAFTLVQATSKDHSDVVFIDEDCVIVRKWLPKAVEPFQHPHIRCKEFGESRAPSMRNIEKDFPLAREAVLYGNFLLLDSEEHLSLKQLEGLREKYRVIAIVKGNPRHGKAEIYTGQEDALHMQLELFD